MPQKSTIALIVLPSIVVLRILIPFVISKTKSFSVMPSSSRFLSRVTVILFMRGNRPNPIRIWLGVTLVIWHDPVVVVVVVVLLAGIVVVEEVVEEVVVSELAD